MAKSSQSAASKKFSFNEHVIPDGDSVEQGWEVHEHHWMIISTGFWAATPPYLFPRLLQNDDVRSISVLDLLLSLIFLLQF